MLGGCSITEPHQSLHNIDEHGVYRNTGLASMDLYQVDRFLNICLWAIELEALDTANPLDL